MMERKGELEDAGKLEMESESAWREMPASIWAGLMAAPIAFAINLGVGYMLAASICEGGGSELPLHFIAGGTLALAATGASIAWRTWRRSGIRMPEDHGTPHERMRFMAAFGALMSPLFMLAIIAQWCAAIFYGPCHR